MKATDFECRFQTLLHFVLIGLAVLTYLTDPDDIVWGLVRHHPHSALWERSAFGAGALMMIGSAALETWATAYPHDAVPSSRFRLARLLLGFALALLLPLPGAILLVVGEAVLILRLVLRERQVAVPQARLSSGRNATLAKAVRMALSKWGLAASMIAFAVTLQDRVVEVGAVISLVVWLAVNVRWSLAVADR